MVGLRPRGIRRFFGLRIAAGRVIAIDARVDARQFPEDEFPLVCGQCGYRLRGLTRGICPECGTPFDRGRLLVEQYVLRQAGEPLWRPLNRAAAWMTVMGVIVIGFFAFVFPFLLNSLDVVARKLGWLDALGRWLKPMLVTATLMVVVGGTLWLWLHLRSEKKAQRVIAALDTSPAPPP